jgi:hypothetical protein
LTEDELTPASYAVRLEDRAMALLMGIANDTIDLPGVDPDPALIDVHAPLFYPTDASTQLSVDDPTDPDGTPRVFDMVTRF